MDDSASDSQKMAEHPASDQNPTIDGWVVDPRRRGTAAAHIQYGRQVVAGQAEQGIVRPRETIATSPIRRPVLEPSESEESEAESNPTKTPYTISEDAIGNNYRAKLAAIDKLSKVDGIEVPPWRFTQPSARPAMAPHRAPELSDAQLDQMLQGIYPDTHDREASKGGWVRPQHRLEKTSHPRATSGVIQPQPTTFAPPGITIPPQNTSSFQHGNFEPDSAASFAPDPDPLADPAILQNLMQRIKELEVENRGLRQDTTDPSSINVQTFHLIDSPDGRPDITTSYLSEPGWEMHGDPGKCPTLRCRHPVQDLRGYAEKHNISFIVLKKYTVEHQRSAVEAAVTNNDPLPIPEPASQNVMLASEEMVEAMMAFFAQYQSSYTGYSRLLSVTRTLPTPYTWWYHCRKSPRIQGLPERQANLVTKLVGWIEGNYGSFYDKISDQFSRGKVSRSSVEYLIRPGDVLVSGIRDIPRGHIATSFPYPDEDKLTPSYESKNVGRVAKSQRNKDCLFLVGTQSFSYAGDFFWVNEAMGLGFGPESDNEVDIASLDVVLLKYASHEVQDTLRRRGSTFWKCRNKRFVLYEGQRFMIDCRTYEELHPKSEYSAMTQDRRNKEELSTDGSEPKAPEIYLFPTKIPGFDLRRKKWTDLKVDRIRDVTWNEGAFSNLVADEDMKELILALVTNQLDAEKGTDLIDNKGNGLIMLLHGPPGTGKTFTAESVAEIARKPLYTVTCGDIGTEPEAVEKYLESVFHLGKIWDCVVLLDEAEVFLEQRTLQDLKRNALVSVFLRALEYYEGILILTTNRVGTFDEAFKSRIQLALRYEKLKDYQRKQIWRNFFDRLKGLGEHDSIDFDDLVLHLDELAEYPMNGRQIRNSITTARQLAKYMKRKMTFSHLKRAITVADKFDRYLADVREADVEEDGRGENGRYTDEFFARSDQIR